MQITFLLYLREVDLGFLLTSLNLTWTTNGVLRIIVRVPTTFRLPFVNN